MSAQSVRNYSDEAMEKLKLGGDTEKAAVLAELAKAHAILALAQAVERRR